MLEEWNDYQAYSNDARSAGSLDDSHSRPAAQADLRGGVSGGPRGSVVTGAGAAGNDTRPMFNIEKLEWWPTAEQGPVVSMDAGNNVLFIGTANNFVIRWNVDTDELDEILVSTKKDRIAKVFIDPTGLHGLISMENGVNYYLPARRDKPVILSKLKGPVMESVAWYTSSVDNKSVSRALIGTPRGLLFDLVLEDGKERSCKKVFDLSDSGIDSAASQLISSCHVEQFPASAPSPPAGGPHPRFFVMIATPMRYYEFVGGPTIEAVFATQNPNLAFTELPGSLGYSELRFSTSKVPLLSLPDNSSSSQQQQSTSFAWLTAAGLFQGRLNFGSQSQPGERVVCDGNLVEYPVYPDVEALERLEAEGRGVGLGSSGPRLSPLSIALTEFHFLLLFRNRLIAINRLSKEIVYDCVLSRREIGVPQALCHDAKQDTLWLHTDRHVFEVEISDEARDVWSIHLAQGRYDLASRYARTPAQRDRVLSAQADALFIEGKYSEAAEAYAVSNRSFEDVTLKFVGSHAQALFHSPSSTAAATAAAAGADKGANAATLVPLPFASAPTVSPDAARVALKTYLRAKLRTVRNSDLTQLTMLCVWLVELYLDTINRLAAPPASAITISDAPAGSSASSVAAAAVAAASSAGAGGGLTSIHAAASETAARVRARADVQEEQRAAAVSELRDFLEEYADCLPRDTTLDLLGSHGLLAEMLHFATVVDDIGFVLDHQVQHGQYDGALDILGSKVSQAGVPEVAELFYRFAPDLIVAKPERTVDLLLRARALDPLQLIPTFLRCGVKVYDDNTVDIVPNSPLTGTSATGKGVAATASASAAISSVARSVAASGTGASSSALQRATEAKLSKLGMGSQVLSVGSSAAAAADLRKQLAASSAMAADGGSLEAEEDDDDDDHDERDLKNQEPTEVSQQVCRYLSKVIESGATAPVIHHFYILLLSRLHSETPLLDYISTAFETERCFDVNFALRVAHSATPPKLHVCVLLLRHQCLYRDMLRLALRVSPMVAKDALVAASPALMEKPELRRQLWLTLARALSAAQWPARKILQILHEVESGIALEDILPSFPDLTCLGDLKEDVLDALGGYTHEIEELKADVESLTAAATEIRFDLQRLTHRSGTVTARHRCDLCAHPAALRGFLYFPCTHVFHEDCARNAALHYVNGGSGIGGSSSASSTVAGAAGKGGRKEAVIKQLLEDVDDDSPLAGLREAALAGTKLTLEQEAAVFEEFAQSQCPLCGDIMINSVADPFVDPVKEADEVASWVI